MKEVSMEEIIQAKDYNQRRLCIIKGNLKIIKDMEREF